MDSGSPPATPLDLHEARDLLSRREWRVLAERAAGLPRDDLLREPELAFLSANAWMRTGAAAQALEVMRAVEPEIRITGDRRLAVRAINLLGALLFEAGLTAEAEERFAELLDRSTEWRDDEFAARASNNLGVLASVRGQRESALTFYQRALASYHRLASLRGLAQTHYNVGMAYRELGFAEEADAHYARATRYGEESASEDVIGLAESDRGLLCVQTGDPLKGEALARRARVRFDRLGDPVRGAEAARVLAAAASALGRAGEAELLLQDALRVGTEQANILLLAEVQRDRGLLLRDRGDSAAAGQALQESLEHFSRLGATSDAEAVRALSAELAT